MRNALIRLAALVLLAVSLGLQAGDVVTPCPLSATESHYHWFVIRRPIGRSATVDWLDDFFEASPSGDGKSNVVGPQSLLHRVMPYDERYETIVSLNCRNAGDPDEKRIANNLAERSVEMEHLKLLRLRAR